MNPQHDPWVHRELGWAPELAASSESLLALSNGYLGIRGTLDEGEPCGQAGTYLNGLFESIPLQHLDWGHGDPDHDQVLLGVADGTRIRVVVDGCPLDMRTGTVLRHERVLDFRTGLLTRTLHWRAPHGGEVLVVSRRLVSLARRELAAVDYAVEAIGGPRRVTVISELGVRPMMRPNRGDPRAGAAVTADTLLARSASADGRRAVLVHEARHSGHVVAAGMEHLVVAAAGHQETIDADDAGAAWTGTATLTPGRPLRIVKLLAYHWSPRGIPQALADDARTSLDWAAAMGFDGLAAAQRAAVDDLWSHADLEIDGDPELQHALRYSQFVLHQNAAHAQGHAIPAKGLTGPGYQGHTFWDTEIFLLPVLLHCAPRHVEAALRWRASTLDAARARAKLLGLRGAAFPWRTIDGRECSSYLPAGTAAFHVNADIAHAVVRYLAATGDAAFEREAGAPLLVETARLWLSLGRHDERRGGCFSIDGVTGPDEYSALVDNNLYTNVMAQANLRAAAEVVDRLGSAMLDVSPDEPVAWRRAADAMVVPYDADEGIHLQDEDFARHARFDFAAVGPDDYPLFLHVPYFELYRRQVVKQPDLVLAMALRPELFSRDQRRRNFVHYEALTVRDSSLAAGTNAVLAAEAGDVDLAYDYLAETALLDHHDLARNTADGLHLAALAGGWTAVVDGLAGHRQTADALSFAPRLPEGLTRIAFPFTFRGRRLRVEVHEAEVIYRLLAGAPLELQHWGATIRLAEGDAVARPVPPPSPGRVIRQPPGRSPRRRADAHRHA